MSAKDDAVVIKTDTKQHVALRGMAARCTQAATLAQKFREEHPDLKLINHLVVINFDVFYIYICKKECVISFIYLFIHTECRLYYRLFEADCGNSSLLPSLHVSVTAEYVNQGSK